MKRRKRKARQPMKRKAGQLPLLCAHDAEGPSQPLAGWRPLRTPSPLAHWCLVPHLPEAPPPANLLNTCVVMNLPQKRRRSTHYGSWHGDIAAMGLFDL